MQLTSLIKILEWPRKKIRAMYAWVTGWAESRRAEQALFGIAFAESSFFPIPPDPLLIAMVTASPMKFLRYATICSVASVLGGIGGYLIGLLLFGSIGTWVIETYHLQEMFEIVRAKYDQNAFLTVFTAAFTPIPYKIITIAAGVFRINFASFLVASIIGRSARFFLVAWLMHHLGKRYKDKIEQYIDVLSVVFVILLVLGFVVLGKM